MFLAFKAIIRRYYIEFLGYNKKIEQSANVIALMHVRLELRTLIEFRWGHLENSCDQLELLPIWKKENNQHIENQTTNLSM